LSLRPDYSQADLSLLRRAAPLTLRQNFASSRVQEGIFAAPAAAKSL
jgi:hypothetical protein